MVGVPVIINHKDLNKENADDERVGVVNSVWYDEKDGWYWCDGIIWDETAQNLITDKDWSVSCSYDVKTANDEGGSENNIKYDMEFLDGVFTHLALVNNPRYERANIVFNSKTVIENYRPDQKRDKNGRWTKEDYNAEIDKILKGEYPRGKQIKVKDKPSEIWLNAGLQDAEMMMPVGVYEKSTTEKHNVSEKTMRNLPDLLDDPLYIFKSSTHPDSFVGVLDDFEDSNGIKKPLIAAVKPVGGQTEINILTSIYGKDKDFTNREILKGNLLYDKSQNNKTISNSIVASIATETSKPSTNIIDYVIQSFNPNVKEIEQMEIENEKDQKGKWVTIKGTHVFIPDGKTLDEAVKEKFGGAEGKEKESVTDYKKSLDRIEKLIKKYNLEPHEEDELLDELGSFEAALDEAEPRKEEALHEQLLDFEEDIKRHHEMKKDETKEQEPSSKADKIKYINKKTNADIDESDSYSSKDIDKLYKHIKRGGEIHKVNYEWIPKHDNKKANNSKEQEMEIIEKLKALIFSVENEKEYQMEVNNEKVDKRKLIDEIGGILKGKVDDEVIRTIIGKAEKLSYNDSEKSADNEKVECKEEDKKEEAEVKNEAEKDEKEVKEVKEEVKEDVENKCKNSVENSMPDFFGKLNEIYNSASSQMEAKTDYVSRVDREQAAVDYFTK